MNLGLFIIMCIVFIMTKDIKRKRKNKMISSIAMTVMCISIVLMYGYLTYDYFNSAIKINEFNVNEKIYENKGVSIYTISEDGQEKYLILKGDGIFDKVFLHAKPPIQEGFVTNIDTFKYKHTISMENSQITHNYEKKWGNGVFPFWLILVSCLCCIRKNQKLAIVDKAVLVVWSIITVGVTVFFMF